MPILKITAEMVGPDRTRLALGYVESVMLWPDEEQQRHEAIKTGTAAFIGDAIGAVPAARRAVEAAGWIDSFALLADAFPLRHIQEHAKKRFVYGVVVGEFLAAAIAAPPMKLEALKTDLTEALTKRATASPWFPISRSTFENTIWSKYKPVSHLWGSYVLFSLRGVVTFPCALDTFPQFLSLARRLAEVGSLMRLSRRGAETLLDNAKIWLVPDELNLPEPVMTGLISN